VILAVASIAFWQMNQGAQAAMVYPHPGLVGWWRFDEESGTVAGDSSGYGNVGTIYGATWVTGEYGKALSFDGNDYVSITFTSPINISLGLSGFAWIYPTTNTGTQEIIFSDTAYIFFRIQGTKLTLYVAQAGGGFIYAQSVAVLPINTWTHVAFTYDGTTFKLYINSVNDGTTSGVPLYTSMTTATVGAQVGVSEYFMGVIDEVRVYNRALSAAEIQADFQKSPDFSSKLLAKVPKGTTQVIVTLSWQGIGNINVTVQSPSVNYTEDNVNVPVYQKTVYSTSSGTSTMLNIKRLSVSVSALSSDENWYVSLALDNVDAYQITVEVQK
jgi:hypothetical protein